MQIDIMWIMFGRNLLQSVLLQSVRDPWKLRMGVHMLREGGPVFQTRWEAEEADHAAYKAKQERVAERKRVNYQKRAEVT
jgi:hypothetical protein